MNAYSCWDNLESVTIPESVLSIGNAAFGDGNPETGDDGTSGLQSLRTVTIEGNHLRYIGSNAFCGDGNLTYIDLPDSVSEIGEFAFAYSALEFIELPAGLKTIHQLAFADTNSNYVIIPETVETIEAGAFSDLPIIVVPPTVRSISSRLLVHYNYWGTDGADFYYLGTMEQLLASVSDADWWQETAEEATDPDNPIFNANVHYNCQLVEQDGLKYIISDGEAILLQADSASESITIPAEVQGVPLTSIAPGAFKYCDSLKTLTIPENIKSQFCFVLLKCIVLKIC